MILKTDIMSTALFNQKNSPMKGQFGYDNGTNSVNVNNDVSDTGLIARKEDTEKIYSLDKIKYISGNDTAFVENIIKLFMQLLKESIQNIEEALRNDDVQLVKKTVHKIKPGLDILDIKILNEEVHAVENLSARISGVNETRQLLDTLQNKMQEILKNLNLYHIL